MIFSRPCGTLRAFKSYPGLSSWATLSRPCGTVLRDSQQSFVRLAVALGGAAPRRYRPMYAGATRISCTLHQPGPRVRLSVRKAA